MMAMRGEDRRLLRFLRLHRFDRNPLRRRWDRLESVTLVVAAVLFALCAVPAVAVAGAFHADGVAAERHGRWVEARLLADAPAPMRVSPESTMVRTTAKVRWSDADGTVRTGVAPVVPGTEAGTTVRLWLAPGGKLVTGPPDRLETVTRAVFAGVGVQLLAGGVLLLGYLTIRRLLDRRRAAAWDAAWSAADLRWGRRGRSG